MKILNMVPKTVLGRVSYGIIAAELLCLVIAVGIGLQKPAAPRVTHQAAYVTPKPTTEILPKTVNAGLPTRIKIPKINVDAALDQVTLTASGELGAPKSPGNAAWYSKSPRPGDTGNAIIDGHFGYKDHLPAVFDNLHMLQKGDTLLVQDEKGVTVTFVVRDIHTYAPGEDTTDVFRPTGGKSHLNLITCQGTWNEAKKSYSQRLVVFADKVTS
ncbi:MAG TPA: class F sortase [Patescibacteria group bacterium]|nr:class F sortase [Patescibacteria group bacterium]